MIWAKIRLALALIAFFGWLGYLGYASLSRSQGPHVSVAIAAAAKTIVKAEVKSGADGKPERHVKGVTLGDSKAFEADIMNITQARGYTGPGQYLLLLEPDGDAYRLVLPPRSPGYDRPFTEAPTIYPWTPNVEAQAAKLAR